MSSQAATSQPSASDLSLTSVSSENSDLVALNGAIDMVDSEIVLNLSRDSAIMAVPIYRQQAHIISSETSSGETASMRTQSFGSIDLVEDSSKKSLK